MRLFTARWLVVLCALCGLTTAGWAEDHPLPTIPYVKAAPPADGNRDEGVWASALTLNDFTLPESATKPEKAVEAKLLYDDSNLYIAVRCAEKSPANLVTKISQDNADVWMDDCVEIFIRTSRNVTDYDQFLVTPKGVRGWKRVRAADGGGDWTPSFKAHSVIGQDNWTTMVTIPFKDLDTSTPKPGDIFELKLGRHDAVANVLSTWPAGSHYSGNEDYGVVYFKAANLLKNPTFASTDGKLSGWSLDPSMANMIHAPEAGTGADIVFDSVGKRVALSQELKLQPGRVYRLEGKARGSNCLFSAITKGDSGQAARENVPSNLSDDFQLTFLQFSPGPDGKATIIVGPTDESPKGKVELANLQVFQDVSYPTVGPCIPIRVNSTDPLVVRKLIVADCRALWGFIGIPVDGTTNSWGWDYRYTEYNRRDYGPGVDYHYRGNDGLNIKFSDDKGFNAVVVRGGVKADFYRNCPKPDSPEGGTLLAHLKGMTRDTTRLWFDNPVKTDSVSFFDVSDGYIADLSFFRVDQDLSGLPEPQHWSVADETKTELPETLRARFSAKDQKTYRLVKDAKGGAVTVEANQFVHLVIPAVAEEMPLAAIGLDFNVASDGNSAPIAFTARVQDAIDLQRELYGADFQTDHPGRVHFVMKFPNQILPKGSPVCISLRFDKKVRLENMGVNMYVIERAAAAPEALAYRKFQFHSMFCCLSESRPWNGWPGSMKEVQTWLEGRSPQVRCVREMVEALEHCRYIGLPDSEIAEYYQWIWHNPLRKEGKLPAFTPKLDLTPGAPKWACLARQAWLSWREVPEWWLDHRLAPTGEFGGDNGDDHNMYQNFQPFPMFETDGVGGRVKKAGEAMAEFGREMIIDGVNKETTDPLHAYEQGMDQESMMTVWDYGDPVYLERCMEAAKSIQELTVLMPNGHRHFRTQDISASKRNDPHTDIDGQAHPDMMNPAFEVARYNQNPAVLKMLHEWEDGWLEHQKPGEYATEVEVATEKPVVSNKYPFQGAEAAWGAQGSGFYDMYLVTGDAKYLRPFMEVAQDEKLDMPIERLLWPSGVLHDLYNSGMLDKLPNLSELAKHHPVVEAEFNGNKDLLCDALTASIAEIQRYKMMYTYAEVFPDRVFLIEPVSVVAQTYTGGYGSRNRFNHTYAVSYEGLGTDYAALVMANRTNHLKVLLYNFADHPLTGRLHLWGLDHGDYRVTSGVDTTGHDAADHIDRDESREAMRGTALEVTLAAKQTTVLELTQTKKLDDIRLRADLALSHLDTRVDGSAVEGFVHNIGAKSADVVEVALVDATGKVVQRKSLGSLAAPEDFQAKKIAYRFEGLPADVKGWAVVVDPDNKVQEIYKGNNRVELAR